MVGIKTMKTLPDSCIECKLCAYIEEGCSEFYICQLTQAYLMNAGDLMLGEDGSIYEHKRHPNCPLVEIKNS